MHFAQLGHLLSFDESTQCFWNDKNLQQAFRGHHRVIANFLEQLDAESMRLVHSVLLALKHHTYVRVHAGFF